MEKIKYAIFDADGTLMDSMHIWDTLDGAYLMMRGIVPDEIGILRKYGYLGAINHIMEHYNLNASFDDVKADMMKILEYYYNNAAVAKNGIKEFLQKLKDNGVKCAVATATDRFLMEPALERNGLLEYFDAVFTTVEVGISKDEPDIFNIASEFLGADENTFIFEDASYAIDTAKRAGYKVIAIEDYSAEADREHIKEAADYFITDYSQVYSILDLPL